MEDKEREIDLRQLVILIMMQWRIITCVTLICMTLGAFLVFNRSGIAINHQDTDRNMGYNYDESYEYKLSLYKKLKIYYESELKKHLRQAKNEKIYIENSIRKIGRAHV